MLIESLRNRMKLIFLSVLLLAGCGDLDGGSGGNTFSAPDPGISTLTSGDFGFYQNVGDEYVVVRSREAYTFLASWTTRMTSFPVVNFDNDIVFASILGVRPTMGYTIANQSATLQGDVVEVNVVETVPSGIVNQVVTYPYAFSSLPSCENIEVTKDGIPVGKAMEYTFEELVNDHILQIDSPLSHGASEEHRDALENKECPFDNTDPLFTAVLKVDLTGMDLSNIAFYCPEHTFYWVRREQPAFVGTWVQWLGAFRP
jgi:hypothetical protein